MLPDFICIGTYRAGTTWLQRVFEQHPGIFVPDIKETMFFSHYFDRGIQWYEEQFKYADSETLVGEICPTYLSCVEAPERIYNTIPNCRLIAILRNPVDQIYSLYKLKSLRGYTNEPLKKEIVIDKEYILNVLYYKNLSNYLKYFRDDHLKILLYDNLIDNPDLFLRSIYSYLGVNEHLPKMINKKINLSGKARSVLFQRIIVYMSDRFRNNSPFRIKYLLNKLHIMDTIKSFNTQERLDSSIDAEVKDYIEKITYSDIKKLSKLIGRDLSFWYNRPRDAFL